MYNINYNIYLLFDEMHWFKWNHKALTLKFNEETGSATCVVLLPTCHQHHDLTLSHALRQLTMACLGSWAGSSRWAVFFSLFSCFFMICPWLSIGNIWVFPKMVEIWMFPKIVGFTPKSSILMGIFHYFHHPFWGTPNFWKHPYIAAGSDELCKVGVANSSRKQLGRCVKLFKKRFCVKFSGLLLWRLYMVTSLYHFSMTFTSFFLNSPLHIAAKKIET